MNATLLAPPKPPCATRLDVDFTSTDRTEQERAKAVCRTCPIRQACRDEAIRTRRFGSVRGGLDPRQLRAAARFADRKTGGAIHNRARYVSGKCGCAQCRAANARYMSAWRKRGGSHVTRAVQLAVVVLDAATGKGKRRAYAGQVALDLGRTA